MRKLFAFGLLILSFTLMTIATAYAAEGPIPRCIIPEVPLGVVSTLTSLLAGLGIYRFRHWIRRRRKAKTS